MVVGVDGDVPLRREVAGRHRGLGALDLAILRAEVDAVLALEQEAEEPGRLEEGLGPDAELG